MVAIPHKTESIRGQNLRAASFALLVAVLVFGAQGCGSQVDAQGFSKVAWEGASAQVQVEGMTCENCAKSISQALRDLPAVEAVDIDVESGMVSVRFQEEAQNPSPSDLATAVKRAGFRALACQ